MNDSSKAQTKSFLTDTRNKMKIKLAEAETANMKSTDDVKVFTSVIAAIDLALAGFE